MAVSKCCILTLGLVVVSILVLHQMAAAAMLPARQLTGNPILGTRDDGDGGKMIDCGGACKARCQSSSRPNLCHRACGTCCARCNCVPPGTFGNYDACPCYANMTTHGNKRKCP